jgi:RNA-directed DNA polymerase
VISPLLTNIYLHYALDLWAVRWRQRVAKTRLIESGRFAAERRRRRGLGKPETFNFLGFTFIGGGKA